MEAVNHKVAEQYVSAFANLAKAGNTLIVPGNMADMGSMIAAALTIVKQSKSVV
jgi:ribosomal protein L18E